MIHFIIQYPYNGCDEFSNKNVDFYNEDCFYMICFFLENYCSEIFFLKSLGDMPSFFKKTL